jgi:hypothetical protein
MVACSTTFLFVILQAVLQHFQADAGDPAARPGGSCAALRARGALGRRRQRRRRMRTRRDAKRKPITRAYPRGSTTFRRSVSDGASPKQALYARENSPKCQKPQLTASAETVVDARGAANRACRTRFSRSRVR